MARRRKSNARSAAAEAAVALLTNPEVLRRLAESGSDAIAKIAERLATARSERRLRNDEDPRRRLMNPLGADRLAVRIDSAAKITDDIGKALTPDVPPALVEMRGQVSRLSLSLQAARGFPALRRFPKLRDIDRDLDDLEDALFELIRGGAARG